jgi:hypothetical protein
MDWLPKIGWVDITPAEAAELDLPVRTKWQIWRIEWRGHGFTFKARAKR